MIITKDTLIELVGLAGPAVKKLQGAGHLTIGAALALTEDQMTALDLNKSNIGKLMSIAKDVVDELPSFVSSAIENVTVASVSRVRKFEWDLDTDGLTKALRPYIEATLGKLPAGAVVLVGVRDAERTDDVVNIEVTVPVAG